jgi:hypothetical protein
MQDILITGTHHWIHQLHFQTHNFPHHWHKAVDHKPIQHRLETTALRKILHQVDSISSSTPPTEPLDTFLLQPWPNLAEQNGHHHLDSLSSVVGVKEQRQAWPRI